MKRKLVLIVVISLIMGLLLPLTFKCDRDENKEDEGYLSSRSLIIPVTSDEKGAQLLRLNLKSVASEDGGHLFVEAGQTEFLESFLAGARRGVQAAETYLGHPIRQQDLILSVDAQGQDGKLLTGYSAGAAVGVMTVALISDRKIKDKIAITGTISSEGEIGPVGGLDDKIKAAKERGFTLLLPTGGGNKKPNKERQLIKVSNLTQAVRYALN